jgi:hypothetical protein
MKAKSSASSPAVSRSIKTGKVLGRLIPLLLIFGALTAPWIVKNLPGDRNRGNGTQGVGVDWRQSSEKVRKSLDQVKSEAAEAEDLLWRVFTQKLEAAKRANRKETNAGVESTVNTLVQAGEIGWLIADYAQDNVLGGDRAKRRIEACSGPFNHSLKNSSVRVDGLIDGLQQDLAALNNRYAIAVGEVIEQEQATMPRSNFEHLMRARENVTFDTALEVGGASAAVTLELITIRTTKEAIVEVYHFLARKLAPQIAKGAVGVGAAAVDGPLPIGDILTVGLAAWTVYDVASLPGAIREDVRKEFGNAADEHLRLLDQQVDAAVAELAKRSRGSREKMHEELLTGL